MNVSASPLQNNVSRIPENLRIVLLLDETPFFHPHMTEELLCHLGPRVIRVLIVDRIPPRSDLRRYLVRNMAVLRLPEVWRLGLRWLKVRFGRSESWMDGERRRYSSVRQVVQRFGTSVGRIDSKAALSEEIREQEVEGFDVLISSNSLILTQAVLSAPTLGCINRHSALLPAYGGLWPVFQAVRRGSDKTGVSVHDMTERIDVGPLRSRVEIPIPPKATVFSLYEATFKASSTAIIEALANLVSGVAIAPGEDSPSYFSMPTRAHWKEFRERGGSFV